MGRPMATNLLKAGLPVTVWNRTPSKVQPLLELGAKAGKGPAHVAAEVDVVITMVSQPKDVEDVVFRNDGVLDGIKKGSVLIDMTTVDPGTSRKVAGAIAAKQAEFLDAPVVGSKGSNSLLNHFKKQKEKVKFHFITLVFPNLLQMKFKLG